MYTSENENTTTNWLINNCVVLLPIYLNTDDCDVDLDENLALCSILVSFLAALCRDSRAAVTSVGKSVFCTVRRNTLERNPTHLFILPYDAVAKERKE